MNTTATPSSAGYSSDERRRLATMLIQLFEHWELPKGDQLTLLGLSENNCAALIRYRAGKPLADHRDLLDRAAMLLGIHSCLRLLFPQNRELAYRWMRSPNRAFQNMTPVEAVRVHGLLGLVMVHNYLDCARGSLSD